MIFFEPAKIGFSIELHNQRGKIKENVVHHRGAIVRVFNGTA
jgi:hypothetical protein